MATDKIRLGVSACLLGQKVRYDGGHKLDRFLTDTLGRYVDFVPICPEVESGLPVPRQALRLVGDPAQPRLVFQKTGEDWTENMKAWAEKRLDGLAGEGLLGFIFKSKSPSSGMERVKVYNDKGMPAHNGVGIFARSFMERFPLLPVEEEGRLHDPKLREMFIERVFVFQRWRDDVEPARKPGGLVDFHARHKLLVMAHSPDSYRRLGRIAAQAGKRALPDLKNEYLEGLAHALSLKTTVPKNVNVLHHLLGYFKKQLTADEKQEFLEVADNYAAGHLPLIVPVTLINHWTRKYDQEYLKGQYYLNPHPVELRLRNHA